VNSLKINNWEFKMFENEIDKSIFNQKNLIVAFIEIFTSNCIDEKYCLIRINELNYYSYKILTLKKSMGYTHVGILEPTKAKIIEIELFVKKSKDWLYERQS
jgi:hypothetical protein